MIRCNRCKKETHEKFIAIYKECEYCGNSIDVNIYEFIGDDQRAKSYEGIWTSKPERNGYYAEGTTYFCSMDSNIKILSEVYPKDWKLIN